MFYRLHERVLRNRRRYQYGTSIVSGLHVDGQVCQRQLSLHCSTAVLPNFCGPIVALSSRLSLFSVVSTCLHRGSCCLGFYGVTHVDALPCTLMKTEDHRSHTGLAECKPQSESQDI